jgi:hypothetical protein
VFRRIVGSSPSLFRSLREQREQRGSLLTPSHAQGEFPFQSDGLESGAEAGPARGA